MKEVPFSGSTAEKASEDFSKKKTAESRLSHVRTYRGDVEELITKKKVTRTHVAIAEEERRRAIGESSVWEERKAASILPLLFAGLFLLVGLSVLLYDLGGKSALSSFFTKPVDHAFAVHGENAREVGLFSYTRDELTRSIRTIAREEKLAQGEHLRIAFRARTGTSSLPLPVRNLFLTLESSPPDALLRSLAPVYEGGLLSAGETKGYLVFTTTYYENSVVGLLSWEKEMSRDLYPVIDPLRAEIILEPAAGTWRAEVWKGYDLRVFTTEDSRVALVYGWIDKKTLIITGSVQVFTEVAKMLLP
jgi:hypothetical protein